MRLRSVTLSLLIAAALALVPLGAAAGSPPVPRPGAAGIGDPYFPTDGNGGYDVGHYDLAIRYAPETDLLVGTTQIRARATQTLSRFNLDLVGLTVRSVVVNGRAARWTRDGSELVVVPARKLPKNSAFTVVVRYDGAPQPLEEFGLSGFIPTADGALVAGQPHVASTWFPVNDHPADKATYHLEATVPEGLTAVGNGALKGTKTSRGWTTWTWEAPEPMASYLVTATIGKFELTPWRHGRIRGWDAIDPTLFEPYATPRTGTGYLFSGRGDNTWTRLTRTVDVPAGGATLSFWVNRATEQDFDFFLVEARHADSVDWTTLPDANGHSTDAVGFGCPSWFEDHPFLRSYQAEGPDLTCTPQGTSGVWNAASGFSDGWEQWSVDLGAYAGSSVEVSLGYVSDLSVQLAGLFVDDVVVSTGVGSTSFEADGDTLDGWAVTGPPAGSPGNATQWAAGDATAPDTIGADIEATFARQGEVLDVLSSSFGPYPFTTAGGIVDALPELGFALENQTRPIYAEGFFGQGPAEFVVAHELAHQWYGDSLALHRWRDIWLNEGFATYAEWLWGEHEGFFTPQDVFDSDMGIPADDEFWNFTIGDPGAADLFDGRVYERGGLTLHALRLTVGDDAFFRILRTWASTHRGGNVTTAQFVALAERISGQQLDALFDAWLYSPTKPPLPAGAVASARAAGAGAGLTASTSAAVGDWRSMAAKVHRH